LASLGQKGKPHNNVNIVPHFRGKSTNGSHKLLASLDLKKGFLQLLPSVATFPTGSKAPVVVVVVVVETQV